MTDIATLRRRQIDLMQTTCLILGHVVATVTQAEASTWRDGSDGWTILEVVAHLRDFDGFFQDRVRMMLSQEYPQLPAFDQDALAIERGYNQQQLTKVYEELAQSRRRFVALFESLDDAQWERSGVHPSRGHFTLTDAVMQVGSHDALHLEQITRVIAQHRTP